MKPIIKTFKYHNGQIQCQIPFVNGKGQGTALWWHPNGQLNHQIPYVNGKIHGTALYWLKNGQLHWLDLYRSDNRLLEIKLLTKYKNIPTHKPLFNKAQFKQLCNQQ